MSARVSSLSSYRGGEKSRALERTSFGEKRSMGEDRPWLASTRSLDGRRAVRYGPACGLGRCDDRVREFVDALRPPVAIAVLGGAGAALLSTGGPLWALYAARGLAVFQQGMLGARAIAVQGWDATGAPEEGRAPRLGMLGAAFGAGFVVGPALGAAFGREDPDRVARGAAVAYLATALLVLLTAPGGTRKDALSAAGGVDPASAWRSARGNFLRVVGSPGAPALLAQKAIGDICMAVFVGSFSMLLESRYGRGPRQAGYVLSYVGVLAAAAQGGGVRALERTLGRRSEPG